MSRTGDLKTQGPTGNQTSVESYYFSVVDLEKGFQ